MDSTITEGAAGRALALHKFGFHRAAVDVLEVELRRDPEDGALWRLRAVLLARQGRDDEAFDNIQAALALVPLGPEELLILARGYAASGLKASAESVLAELARVADLPHELWSQLHEALCRAGLWHAALCACRRAAARRPDDDVVYYTMAHTLARLGRPPELCLRMLQRAINLNPAEPRYRASLAIQLLRLGRPHEAYDCLAELPAAALDSIACRCCLRKALDLCIQRGDAVRAATIAGRLAVLAAAAAVEETR